MLICYCWIGYSFFHCNQIKFCFTLRDAVDGFAGQVNYQKVRVVFPEKLLEQIPEEKREGLLGVLEENPAPHYQNDPERVYGFGFAGKEIKFRMQDGVLTVVRVE